MRSALTTLTLVAAELVAPAAAQTIRVAPVTIAEVRERFAEHRNGLFAEQDRPPTANPATACQ
jgi:hypothetical protein